jgi:anti-sigma B factor antagonist
VGERFKGHRLPVRQAEEGVNEVVEPELSVTVDSGPASGRSGPLVRVSGEVDIQTSHILDEHLQRILSEGHASMVVDLSQVTFLDSTGLSVLINALKRCQGAGGHMRLESPRPHVRRVFEVTGLSDVFDVTDSGGTTPAD